MVNPVDVQALVVRAVDASQSVNQVQNAPLAAQHTGQMTEVQRFEHERNMVVHANAAEEKNVQNSLEGENRGFYSPGGGRRGYERKNRSLLRDDKRGLILDVRL